tara:strand:+ start:648 stop:896 length:249 start_codon:yes stop_codon:yes gene_type:complete
MLNKIKELNNMFIAESSRDNKKTLREKRLSNILFANGQELTEAGWEYAKLRLKEMTVLEAAVDINKSQNNGWSGSTLLFVEC